MEETKNIVVNEAAQEITKQVAETSKTTVLKNGLIAGGVMTLGAVAWEFGIKKLVKGIKKAAKGKKQEREERKNNNESESDEE